MSTSGPLCSINTFTIRWRKGTFVLSWLLIDPTDHGVLGCQSHAYPGNRDGVESVWDASPGIVRVARRVKGPDTLTETLADLESVKKSLFSMVED